MSKILVIDDEPELLRSIGRTLKMAGHEVHAFSDGRRALEHLAQEPADLLITDIFMPEIEGMEMILRARALRPQMPILAMSGFPPEHFDALKMAGKLGAGATLKKPFRPAELRAAVARLLHGEGDQPAG